MKLSFIVILSLFVTLVPSFGESHPEYVGIEDPLEYALEIDDSKFTIPYHVDANVIKMAIDPELTSLLIGLENTSDSIFEIDLQHNLISAPNNDFAILVNGLEVNYDIVSDSDSSKISFFVPTFTEEVEIIGTHVIPEFPLGVIIGFTILISSIVAISWVKIPVFRL